MEKEKLLKIAEECFTANPTLTEIHVVSDGNAYTKKDRASQLAKQIGGTYMTVNISDLRKTEESAEGEKVITVKTDANTGQIDAAAEALRVENEEKEKQEAIIAAQDELKTSDIKSVKYPRMVQIKNLLQLEVADDKKATLIPALEAKKLELLNQ